MYECMLQTTTTHINHPSLGPCIVIVLKRKRKEFQNIKCMGCGRCCFCVGHTVSSSCKKAAKIKMYY